VKTRLALAGLAAVLVAAQAQAVYVVILKSGGRVVAREKYQVNGANAVFRTKTGTYTAVPLSQVDVAATERVNSLGLGDAQLLDWVDKQTRIVPTPTPTQPIARLGRVRPGVASPEADAARPTPTPGVMFRDKHFHDAGIDQAFQQGLESYHLYLYRTSQGTLPEYLFIEIQVNGQPETLKALQAVCSTYKLLNEKAPQRVPGRVEMQMINESGKEAGVFRLSAADAEEFVSGKVTAESFFVQHVIF